MIQKVTRQPGDRRLPSPKASRFFNPLQLARWLYSFFAAWIGTRLYSRLLPAFPFLFILVGLAVWALTPKPKLARVYERTRDAATREQNSDLANLAVNRLIRMNPDKRSYRYVLAVNYLNDGRLAEAIRILHSLAPPHSDDALSQADLRLVELSNDDTNQYSETLPTIIRRLTRVVRSEPANFEAHRLLSVAYLEDEQPLAAEPHLEVVCEGNPELMLQLAQLKVRNKKPQEAIAIARRAEQLVSTSIKNGNDKPATVILWSRLLRATGQNEKSEQILTERFRVAPEEYRDSLSKHYQAIAKKQLALSPYYRKQAIQMLGKALLIDPDNPQLARLITDVARHRSRLTAKILDRLSQHWIRRADEPGADVGTISTAALIAQSRDDEENAIRLMTRAAKQDPAYEDSLVQTLQSFGRSNRAGTLFEKLQSRYEQELIKSPTDVAARIRLARLHAGIGQYTKARTVVRSAPESSQLLQKELVRIIRGLLEAGGIDPVELQQLAHEGLALAPLDSLLLTTTSEISQEDGARGKRSREHILKLVTEGKLSASVAYAALGTAALEAENYREAEEDLRRSAQLDRRNPLVWNNLAVVLTRKPAPEPKLAIKAAEFALKLLPNHETLLATYGEALLASRRWSDAAAMLQKCIKLGKDDNMDVHRHLATAYRSLGNAELANRHSEIADEIERTPGANMPGVEE